MQSKESKNAIKLMQSMNLKSKSYINGSNNRICYESTSNWVKRHLGETTYNDPLLLERLIKKQ